VHMQIFDFVARGWPLTLVSGRLAHTVSNCNDDHNVNSLLLRIYGDQLLCQVMVVLLWHRQHAKSQQMHPLHYSWRLR
jgi:hypothetical protein